MTTALSTKAMESTVLDSFVLTIRTHKALGYFQIPGLTIKTINEHFGFDVRHKTGSFYGHYKDRFFDLSSPSYLTNSERAMDQTAATGQVIEIRGVAGLDFFGLVDELRKIKPLEITA
jgi:hypothetical protein